MKGVRRNSRQEIMDTLATLPSLDRLSHAALINLCCQSSNLASGESEIAEDLLWQEFYNRFNKFIKLYLKKALKAISTKFAENCPQEAIEDLSQDVFLRLFDNDRKALRDFRGDKENSFLAYLSQISVNVVMEHMRKKQAG